MVNHLKHIPWVLVLCTSAVAEKNPDLARWAAEDFQGPHHVDCHYYVAYTVANRVDPKVSLLSDKARSLLLLELRSLDGLAQHRRHAAVYGLAEMVNALGSGQRRDFVLWNTKAFAHFFESMGMEFADVNHFIFAKEFLSRLPPTEIKWGLREFHRGLDETLESVMLDAQVPMGHIGILRTARDVIEQRSQRTGNLGRVQAHVKKNNRAVQVCFGSRHCDLHNNGRGIRGLFAPQSENLIYLDELPQGPALHYASYDVVGAERALDLVMVGFPELGETAEEQVHSLTLWYTTYFHEMTHFADFVLFSQWLRANLVIWNEKNVIEDPFFQGNIRVNLKNGKPYFSVYGPFAKAWMESSAYQISAEVEHKLATHPAFSLTEDLRVKYSKYCYQALQLNEYLKTQWNIDENHLAEMLELGATVRRQMETTIEKARRIKPNLFRH